MSYWEKHWNISAEEILNVLSKEDQDELLKEFEKMLDDGNPVRLDPNSPGSKPVAETVDQEDFGLWDNQIIEDMPEMFNWGLSDEELEAWEKQNDEEVKEIRNRKPPETEGTRMLVCECGGQKTSTPHFRWCPMHDVYKKLKETKS